MPTISSATQTNGPSAMNKLLDRKLEDQFDIFLKMFLANLKNQSPDSPVDGMQMTNNLLMFFSASEQAKTNFYLKQMNDKTARDTNMSARSYLNKEVDYLSDIINYKGEDKKEITYEIPATADVKDAVMGIVDLKGNVVDSRPLKEDEITPGIHKIVWDGKTKGGMPADNGHYIVKMAAKLNPAPGKKSAQDLELKPIILGKGRISEVMHSDSGEPQFIVDNIPIRFDDILKVRKFTNPYAPANQAAPVFGDPVIPPAAEHVPPAAQQHMPQGEAPAPQNPLDGEAAL